MSFVVQDQISSLSNDIQSTTVLEAKHNRDEKKDKTADYQTGSQNPIIQSSTVTKNKRSVVSKMAKEENPELYKQLFSKKQTTSTINNSDGVFNDLEAAQKVYEKYPHWVCCDGTLYVFDDKSGLWTESEEVMLI